MRAMTTHELSTVVHDNQGMQHHHSSDNELPVQHKPKRAMIIAACMGFVVGIGIFIGLKALTPVLLNDTSPVQSS